MITRLLYLTVLFAGLVYPAQAQSEPARSWTILEPAATQDIQKTSKLARYKYIRVRQNLGPVRPRNPFIPRVASVRKRSPEQQRPPVVPSYNTVVPKVRPKRFNKNTVRLRQLPRRSPKYVIYDPK